MQYIFRTIKTSDATKLKPFGIIPYTGKQPKAGGPNFTFNTGFCYSSFTYDSGSAVSIGGQIKHQGEGIVFKDGDKAYLDFTILPNLLVSGCQIKCGVVGKEALPGNWSDYPDMYRIRPFDIRDNQGIITQYINGKKQEKAYLMLGFVTSSVSTLSNYNEYSVIQNTGANSTPLYYVPVVNEDIMLLGSQISGVSVAVPFRYFRFPLI